jgi:predicted DsbA family dithiol-disulfide isomerase
VRWLPFQLNPDIPPEGIPRAEYLERKWGPGTTSSRYAQVTAVGRELDLEMNFDRITVQPNTLNAHRVMHFADMKGLQDAAAESLFLGYFTEGANIADVMVLVELGARAGLDPDELETYLRSDEDAELIAEADVDARSSGIGGVPFFIFNRRLGVSGAQSDEVLFEAMRQSLEPSAEDVKK